MVIGNDGSGAERLAYQAARNKAISSAIMSFIRKGSKDEINFNLKRAEILKNPQDFILEEKKTSSKRDNKLLRIVVEIAIDTSRFGKMLRPEGLLADQTVSLQYGAGIIIKGKSVVQEASHDNSAILLIINGPAGVGKSTVSKLIAAYKKDSAVVRGDQLKDFVVDKPEDSRASRVTYRTGAAVARY